MVENIVIEDYGSIQWFCLYELEIPGRIYPQHLLMRLEVPEVSNNNYKGQDLGGTIAECKRDIILSQVKEEWKATKYRLIGYCECSPEGDEFYEESGKKWIDFWTFETKYYRPCMIFVQAANIDDVYNIMDEESNDDWASLNPIYPAKQCTAWLVTEGDYQLSSQAVIDQCIEWTNKAFISSFFTYNYVFYNFLLEKGWYFDKVYSYQELLIDAPVMATFGGKRVPWQGKIVIIFYATNRHLSFITIMEDHGQEKKVEFGVEFSDLTELKCILDYVYYHQEILDSDFKEFIKKILEKDTQAYWEENGQPIEKIEKGMILEDPSEKLSQPKENMEELVHTQGIRRASLSIPAGVKVVWNTFCDIGLAMAERSVGKYDSYFTCDMLLLQSLEHKKFLDLGWYPDMDLSGEYSLELRNDGDDDAYYEYKSRDIFEMKEKIQSVLSLWTETEANFYIPLRVATGWEIRYNNWRKSGVIYVSEDQDTDNEHLLFHAAKYYHGWIHIKVQYEIHHKSYYEVKLYEEDEEHLLQLRKIPTEAEAVVLVEDFMEEGPCIH